MRVLLATIPSSGTCFWHKLMMDHGVDVHRVHLDEHNMHAIDCAVEDGCLLVTTYRDFSKMWRTWNILDNEGSIDVHMKNWYIIQKYNPIIVSVDYNKEASLAVLSGALGVELKTDWAPVNARSEHKLEQQRKRNGTI